MRLTSLPDRLSTSRQYLVRSVSSLILRQRKCAGTLSTVTSTLAVGLLPQALVNEPDRVRTVTQRRRRWSAQAADDDLLWLDRWRGMVVAISVPDAKAQEYSGIGWITRERIQTGVRDRFLEYFASFHHGFVASYRSSYPICLRLCVKSVLVLVPVSEHEEGDHK